MATTLLLPYVNKGSDTLVALDGSGSVVITPPDPTTPTIFSLNVIADQGWTTSLVSTHASLTTGGGPFVHGTGNSCKFFSDSGGGLAAAYGSAGQFSELCGTSGGLWGSFSNETNLLPIFCGKALSDTDTNSVIESMETNFPGMRYVLVGIQEADAQVVKGATYPSGTETYAGDVITATNLGVLYANMQARITALGVGDHVRMCLVLTDYRQADAPVSGSKWTDFQTAFETAGVDTSAATFAIGGDIYRPAGSGGQGHPVNWTADYHMQWMQDAQAAGFGNTILMPEWGVTLSNVPGDPGGTNEADTSTTLAAAAQDIITTANAMGVEVANYWADKVCNGLWENSGAGTCSNGASTNSRMATDTGPALTVLETAVGV